MKLEHGKTYRNSNGEKIGPLEKYGARDRFRERPYDGRYWCEDGAANTNAQYDLIAEWTEGPVRTVTRREVVPGVYGPDISVGEVGCSGRKVVVYMPNVFYDAAELKAAAAVLLELAGALSDGE